ncbi:MAG: LppM family (lipo)protein [Stackebrandtia sp.]
MRHSRSRLRGVMVAAGAVGLLFGLTGCITSEFAFTVNEDGTVSGAVVLAVEEEYLDASKSQEEAVEEFFGKVVGDPTADVPGAVSTEPYEADGYVGRQVNFEEATAEELSERYEQYGFQLTQEDGQYRFDLALDLAGNEQITDEMRETMTITVAATFPGAVVDTDGEVSEDGRSVRWQMDPGASHSVFAVAEGAPSGAKSGDSAPASTQEARDDDAATEPAGSLWWLLWPILAVAAVLAVVAAVFRGISGRPARAPAAMVSPRAQRHGSGWQPADNSVTREMPAIPPDDEPPGPPARPPGSL